MNYVIGDVHGCYKELKLLLDKIETQDPEATIFFVGDWIDRGPQVPETMAWVAENITLDGKYRSVKGNHDMEAYDWFNNEFLLWYETDHTGYDDPPETYYDFAERVKADFGCKPDRIRPFMDTVAEKMPYNIKIDVVSDGKVPVTFRLCHAWHTSDETYSLAERNQINLYHRDYWGSYGSEIIVHGHTPTITSEYQIRCQLEENRPGMIGYRQNAINVDGGCCFFPRYSEYPCMLCAICLETFEEIYPYSLEERLREGATLQVKRGWMSHEALSEEQRIEATYECYLERYSDIVESQDRIDMMERLNLR